MEDAVVHLLQLLAREVGVDAQGLRFGSLVVVSVHGAADEEESSAVIGRAKGERLLQRKPSIRYLSLRVLHATAQLKLPCFLDA